MYRVLTPTMYRSRMACARQVRISWLVLWKQSLFCFYLNISYFAYHLLKVDHIMGMWDSCFDISCIPPLYCSRTTSGTRTTGWKPWFSGKLIYKLIKKCFYIINLKFSYISGCVYGLRGWWSSQDPTRGSFHPKRSVTVFKSKTRSVK
jgi:hypothetical protein